ncbi:hypothetical protein BCY84_14968 [Trypanosoma cruzi cruzi]|nr:hypothetical protein BCY84_14968 [Trypanosoma cruzi cruzi]
MGLKHMGIASMILLNAIFTSFYMDVFMRQHMLSVEQNGARAVSKRNRQIFWQLGLGQLIYAFWRGTRDVFFDWRGSFCFSAFAYLKFWRLSRVGPTWAVSFVLLWLPMLVTFLSSAVQFTLWMALYEQLLVCCESALRTVPKGGLGQNDRGFVAYHILSGVGVGTAYYLSELGGMEQEELYAFRLFTTICGLLAALLLYACGRQQRKTLKAHEGVEEGSAVNSEEFARFAQQTMNRCSMKATMFLWALQGYSSIFSTAFFNIFLDMSSNTVSVSVRILFLLFAYAAPHAVVAVAVLFYKLVGKKSVVSGVLATRAVVGVLFLAVATQEAQCFFHFMNANFSSSIFLLLLFLNRVLTDAMGYLQESILSDLVDEDTVIFSRTNPTTEMTRRLLAMVSKPSGYVALAATSLIFAYMGCSHSSRLEETPGAAVLAGGTALLTSLLTLCAWQRYYNLEGNHLQFVRMALRRRTDKDARLV